MPSLEQVLNADLDFAYVGEGCWHGWEESAAERQMGEEGTYAGGEQDSEADRCEPTEPNLPLKINKMFRAPLACPKASKPFRIRLTVEFFA
jgi:hypothetical protein